MAEYIGDFSPGDIVTYRMNSHKADGTPITFASAALYVSKASDVATTTGVTITLDKRFLGGTSVTGLHWITVDTSSDATVYAAGNDFDVIASAGTIDSISQVGVVIFRFSICNRTPTVNVINGKVTGTSTTQTIVDSSLAAYKSLTGRVVIWKTGTNIGSQVLITAHTDNATTLTVQTMGTVPVSGDTYRIY